MASNQAEARTEMVGGSAVKWQKVRQDGEGLAYVRAGGGRAALSFASDAELVAVANCIARNHGYLTSVIALVDKHQADMDFEMSDGATLRVTHYALVDALGGIGVKASSAAHVQTVANEVEEENRWEQGIKPEPTEGERLARFFATSAHDGHEAVRYEPSVVPRPDDRIVGLADGRQLRIVYRNVGNNLVAEITEGGWGSRCAVPEPITQEVMGNLKAWETAMRAGQ